MKKIAVISDLSGLGKCSLSAALPVISATGVQCCPVTTAVLTNQTGYESYSCTDLTDTINDYQTEWGKLGFTPDSVLTGYMASTSQIDAVIELVKGFSEQGAKIIVDPVMADDGEMYKDYTDEMCGRVRELCAQADVITPNMSELCVLCDENFSEASKGTADDIINRAENMAKSLIGGRLSIVVVTGIFADKYVYTLAVDREHTSIIRNKRYAGSFSGTGDIFSALFTALYTKGFSAKYCIKKAVEFIEKSVNKTTQHSYNSCDGTDFELNLRMLTTRKILNKQDICDRKKKSLFYLTSGALLAAIITIMTAFVSIKTGINEGYIHIGDAIVFICGCLLPPPYAFVSAAIGGAFADLLTGSAMWIPFTAIIKGLNALVFSIPLYITRKKQKNKIFSASTVIMAVASGVLTVCGYFVAESILYSTAVAVTSIPFNLIQSAASIAFFIALSLALDSVKFKSRFFNR